MRGVAKFDDPGVFNLAIDQATAAIASFSQQQFLSTVYAKSFQRYRVKVVAAKEPV